MKRLIAFLRNTCAVAGILFLSILSGCGDLDQPEAYETPKPQPEVQPAPAVPNTAPSQLSQTYKKIIDLELRYAQKGVDLVQEYVDLPEPAARNAATSELDFTDIGTYLPADLSVLTRMKPGKTTRSLPQEVTLEQELDALAEQFYQEFTDALPDPEKALTLPFVTATEEGIQIGDDAVIPYNSLQGAVTVEILNAMVNGENIEELITNFEQEITEFLENAEEENQSRGLIKNGDGRWANGVVNYRWGNLSASHKTAVQTAMNTWTSQTGSKVRFRELPNGGWENFQLAIHAIGCVTISDVVNPGYNGRATVGYVSGDKGYLRLKSDLSGTDLIRTPLHELGHVLGLYHEHQRHDRDNYITVNSSDISNYGKIPKDIDGWRWQYLRVRVGWWTISIPYLAFWSERYSTTYGAFDFSSIMLYPDLPIKNQGNAKTRKNTALSSYDVYAVKSRY